jgi:hypothetical protein
MSLVLFLKAVQKYKIDSRENRKTPKIIDLSGFLIITGTDADLFTYFNNRIFRNLPELFRISYLKI